MSDSNLPPPVVSTSISSLFSPPVMAALRYLLTALSPVLAIVGVVAWSPQQIDHIINVAQQIGVIIGALAAFIGVVLPILLGAVGAIKSTFKANVARIKQDAENKASPLSEPAKQALIAATIAQPEVQTIVTDKQTADAAPSQSVVAAESVKIVPAA